MKKFLKYLLLILFLSLTFLLLNQTSVKAETNKVSTLEELKTAFDGNATIDGNIIKLTDNVILKYDQLNIDIPEVIIDFNGKTIECKENRNLIIFNKTMFKDSSTSNRSEWGGVIFNGGTINVWTNVELTINNGKFIDAGANTNSKLYVAGKLIINDATFSTTRAEPAYKNNYMIRLGAESECIINGGEFSHTDTIIYVGGSKYSNNCRLSINGGNFDCAYTDAIGIYTFYPYENTQTGKKEVITPKITLNNCTINSKNTAIGFWGGCTDEEFKNVDTKILTILGGTYTSSEDSVGSPFEIRTYSDPNTYFNPKDFVLQGGTFESLNNLQGAMCLYGPCKRRV